MPALRRFVVAALLGAALAPAAPVAAQIAPSEYAARRDSLAARVGDGIVVAFGERTPVSDFGPFFQLPAFHYLTGYDYADADLILVVRHGRGTGTLYVTRSTPRRALYYGEEPDSAAIAAATGLPSVPVNGFAAAMDSLAAAGLPFYTLRDFEDEDFAAADSLTRGAAFMQAFASRHAGVEIKDAHPIVDRLRARKSPAEIALLRDAAAVSARGHVALMRNIAPGMHEYDLRAIAECVFGRGGADRVAYGSIVGAGPNGTILHYMKDTRELKPGDLVVVDAAAQVKGYAADITRTLPVSGTFTPAQREIYQLVRDAQAAAERNSRAGMSMVAAQDSSLDVRARGLARLGLVDSATATFDPPWPADCARNPRACRQVQLWAIHGISHGLGLAVHDPVQGYYGDRTFQVGDAFTIEPGLYLSPKLLDILPDTPRNRAFIARVRPVLARYGEMGVRIEDDYVITPQGTERISPAPREIAEVEATIAKRPAPSCPAE
ncbi:MAG TPA: aminopeptidase P N-terminal domain-containing protein [Gemmatimonadales bacterium]|nr:aminopeptidase P N-terminal domain-containing protein [Gemmatimonadales bacterium]